MVFYHILLTCAVVLTLIIIELLWTIHCLAVSRFFITSAISCWNKIVGVLASLVKYSLPTSVMYACVHGVLCCWSSWDFLWNCSVPGSARKVYIDRRAAMEHRSDPSADPDCRNAVFCQLFEGLKPREGGQRPLDYRYVLTKIYFHFCLCISIFMMTYKSSKLGQTYLVLVCDQSSTVVLCMQD